MKAPQFVNIYIFLNNHQSCYDMKHKTIWDSTRDKSRGSYTSEHYILQLCLYRPRETKNLQLKKITIGQKAF